MAMTVQITHWARLKVEKLVEYLQIYWGEVAKDNFIDAFLSMLDRLEEYPHSSPQSVVFPNLYRAVITKRVVVYYRVIGDRVEILIVVDSHQDAKTIFLELKAEFDL